MVRTMVDKIIWLPHTGMAVHIHNNHHAVTRRVRGAETRKTIYSSRKSGFTVLPPTRTAGFYIPRKTSFLPEQVKRSNTKITNN
jgi:hypothetical protein